MRRGYSRRSSVGLKCVAPVTLVFTACQEAPSVLRPASHPAHTLAVLGWWLLIISLVVILIIGVLELIPVLRHRGSTVANTPIVDTPPSTRWIIIGVVVTGIVMIAVFAYSMTVMAATSHPDARAAFTVEIIGHRWWWEARYPRTGSAPEVTTANELHIPVGVPVRLQVTSADVIHSFWIPRLNGKIDLIPGQQNEFWIRADSAGRFRGQCAEYCGLQHSNMAVFVTAEGARQFQEWRQSQAKPAPMPQNSVAAQGERAFMQTCALCHTIRGTEARGVTGPDLTHVASRQTLAGGALTNSRGNLAGWIVNAPSIKPGADMPRMDLAPATLHSIVSYLETLR